MKSRFILAVVTSLMLAGSSQAGLVTVLSDSGGGTVDVVGTAAGADITNFNTVLTEINGTLVNIPLSFDTIVVTDTAGVITGTGTKIIGAPGDQVSLTFAITSGVVFGSHFDMDGVITGVSLPGTTTSGGNTYDFSTMFPGGLITIAIDKTGTDFTKIVNHPGTVLRGSNSGFGVQEAVPEPTSLALMGIGLIALVLRWKHLYK